MAEKLTSAAKKSASKQNIEKKNDELRWEIAVCQASIEKKHKAIKREYHPLRVALNYFARTLICFLFLVAVSWFADGVIWDRIPFGDFDIEDRELYTMLLLPLFLLALCINLLICIIAEKREVKKNGSTEKEMANDVIEVLSEQLRVARLVLAANEMGTKPDEAQIKYYLSFLEKQPKCCANCTYVGEVIQTTTTEYSDGTTTQSKRREYYYCSKMNGAKVYRKNVCNDFLSERVARAFDKAKKLFDETSAEMNEQRKRSSVGFR